jgi:hypothetical protein
MVGLSLLAYWSLAWLRRQAPAAERTAPGMSEATRVPVAVTLLSLALLFGTLVCCRGSEATTHGAYGLVVQFVIAFITASVAGSLAYGAGYRVLRKAAGWRGRV